MKPEKSKIKSDILTRVRLLYVLFILVGLSVVVRLVWVQLFSSEVAYNAGRLESRIFTQEVIPAVRGSILARGGEPLAISLFRYRVEMDFASPGLDSLKTFHEQSDSLATLLSLFFKDKSAAEYRKFFRAEHARRYRLTKGRDTTHLRPGGFFTRLINRLRGQEQMTRRIFDTLRDHTPIKIFPREVDYNEWQELRRYPILNWNMGMVYNVVESDQRIYPQGELARRTIGLTGDRGNYGIEAVYRDELAGRDGKAMRQRIARGFYGRVVASGNEDPLDGADLITTLDLDLQDIADKALRRRLADQNAIWGTAIVMEVQTGEVMALVNLGRNSQGEFSENVNYAIAKRAELGSVFKLATMLALLEDADIPLSTTYDTGDGRPVTVAGAKVQDSHGGFNDMDFRTAVSQSSNVYFAKAVWDRYADRKQDYTDFLSKLHLDRTVGFEAFGERTPLFPDWKRMGGANQALARLSFGYVVELTPMQMITLYNAVANNGQMVAPHLVREIRRNGVLEERIRPEVLVDRICSPSTLRIVRECLEDVCRTGTAAGFFRDTTHFRVAAKTGTAQFSQDGIRYSDGYYIGSMAAYMPADKPRYTILVTIHTKRQSGKAYYGGPLAGPVVKQLTTYLYNREHEWHGRVESDGETHSPVRIKGGSIAEIRRVANKLDAPGIDSDSRNGWGSVATDSLRRITISSLPQDMHTMPDVRGMGLKEAMFLLESRGLRVSFSGRGSVRSQSLAPGAVATPGATVHITLN